MNAITPRMTRHWIAVACAEHVGLGRAGGFIQLGHGKLAPLRRVLPGDRVAYYSPSTQMGGADRLRAFTALGIVGSAAPYAVETGQGHRHYRRDIGWLEASLAPIAPLLDRLDLTAGNPNWGYRFRLGLIAVTGHDMQVIAEAMGVTMGALSLS